MTSVVVLVVLPQEMTQLYARLASSNIALQGERDNKLMSLQAASRTSLARKPASLISPIILVSGQCLETLPR